MNLKFPNFSIIFFRFICIFLMMFGRYEIFDFVKKSDYPEPTCVLTYTREQITNNNFVFYF